MVVTTHPDARSIGIADQSKNMPSRRDGKTVGVRNRLQRDRRYGNNEIVIRAGHFLGDGVCGRHIAFRIVAAQVHASAIHVAALAEGRQNAVHAVFEHRDGGVLHDRHSHGPGDIAASSISIAGTQIGVEQHARRPGNQQQAQTQALENGDGRFHDAAV